MKYNPLKILSENEKLQIVEKLNKQFGIKEVKGIFLQKGEERLFLFQGGFSEEEIKELEKNIQIERVGIYIGKEIKGQMRLSIEATQIFQNQIKKNIFELNKEQAQEWMLGRELLIKTGKRDFLVMKYENNFLGCGNASENKITNFIPKNRRLKNKEN